MSKIALVLLIALAGVGLTGCYQVHSDDDLRTVPVTNNPNIILSEAKAAFHAYVERG